MEIIFSYSDQRFNFFFLIDCFFSNTGIWAIDGDGTTSPEGGGRYRNAAGGIPVPRERRYRRGGGAADGAAVGGGAGGAAAAGVNNHRRFFVVRDSTGALRDPDTLREGESYVLEDIEDEAGEQSRFCFKNGRNKIFRTSKILTLLYQQFSNLLISQQDMSGPRLGALSNNR